MTDAAAPNFNELATSEVVNSLVLVPAGTVSR